MWNFTFYVQAKRESFNISLDDMKLERKYKFSHRNTGANSKFKCYSVIYKI